MCELCKKENIVLLDDFGEPTDGEKYSSAIGYGDGEFKIISYNFDFSGHDNIFTGMKYCPFCGKKLGGGQR